MPLQDLVDDTVRAAIAEDRAFSDLLPQLWQASQTAVPAEMNAALPRLAEGVAEAPPNLGGFLAVISGAWIEDGADPAPVGPIVLRRITEVTAAALAFADAWEDAAGASRRPTWRASRPSRSSTPSRRGSGTARRPR